jgi:hypothetical protein
MYIEGGVVQMGTEKNLSGYVIFPFHQPLDALQAGRGVRMYKYDNMHGFYITVHHFYP